MFVEFLFTILFLTGIVSVLPHSFWMIFHEGPPNNDSNK